MLRILSAAAGQRPPALNRSFCQILSNSVLRTIWSSALLDDRCCQYIQVAFGSYVKYPLVNRWCSQNAAIKFVSGQHVQLLASLEDYQNAVLGCDVDLIVGRDGRRLVISWCSCAAAVYERAGLCVSSENDTAVLECIVSADRAPITTSPRSPPTDRFFGQS